MSPKPIVLSVAPGPFLIEVAFITRYVDQSAGLSKLAHGLQNMDGSHDVGGIGFYGILIAAADYGLSRQMEDHLGLALRDGRFQPGKITNIGADRLDHTRYSGLLEKARLRRWFERIPGNISPKGIEPKREPAPLKTGMTGEKHAAAVPKIAVHRVSLTKWFPLF